MRIRIHHTTDVYKGEFGIYYGFLLEKLQNGQMYWKDNIDDAYKVIFRIGNWIVSKKLY